MAYSRLPDPETGSHRLLLGELLLAGGVAPSELMRACGLGSAALERPKSGYDPDQLRVPAGNPDGSQWTSAQPSPGEVDLVDFAVGSVKFEVVPSLPSDAVVVTTRDGKAIFEDKKVDGAGSRRFSRGVRIEKFEQLRLAGPGRLD